jgi:hypothetical protein
MQVIYAVPEGVFTTKKGVNIAEWTGIDELRLTTLVCVKR